MFALSLYLFLQAVSVGKHVKGYHYIIANLVSLNGIAVGCYFEIFTKVMVKHLVLILYMRIIQFRIC